MTEKTLAKISHVLVPLADMQTMAKSIAGSKMFGVQSEDQAMALMLLCQAEGLHPVLALRRYHIIDGKPAIRADALQGEFEKTGAILWHERTEDECAATFFKDKRSVDAKAVARARARYKRLKAGKDASDLACVDEITIIRTRQDAIDKGIAMTWNKNNQKVLKHNWAQSPRQMLHARCLTEGVRALSPGLIAGVYSEDEIYDFEPEEVKEPSRATIEANVRQATANALKESVAQSGEAATPPVDDKPSFSSSAQPISEENYGDVVCHIGKAEGQMLGRKVSEIHPNVLQWLADNYGAKWGAPPYEQDERLIQAVRLSLYKLDKATERASPKGEEALPATSVQPSEETQANAKPESASAQPVDWREVVVDTPITSKLQGKKLGELGDGLLRAIKSSVIDKCNWTKANANQRRFKELYEIAVEERGLFLTKDELIDRLHHKAAKLRLTESELCKLLTEQGIFEGDPRLQDVTVTKLRFIYLPENWKTVEEVA